jgi:hypothetical protein
MISVLIDPVSPVSRPFASREIDAVARRRRQIHQALVHQFLGLLDVAGDQVGALFHSERRSEHAHRVGGAAQPTVEQQIWHGGLVLHASGQRRKGRGHGAEVENDVGLRLQHHLDIGSVAAPGQPAELGQVAHRRQQELALIGTGSDGPSDHLFRRQHVKHHRGRRAGRHHALDMVGNRDDAAGRIFDLSRQSGPGE